MFSIKFSSVLGHVSACARMHEAHMCSFAYIRNLKVHMWWCIVLCESSSNTVHGVRGGALPYDREVSTSLGSVRTLPGYDREVGVLRSPLCLAPTKHTHLHTHTHTMVATKRPRLLFQVAAVLLCLLLLAQFESGKCPCVEVVCI